MHIRARPCCVNVMNDSLQCVEDDVVHTTRELQSVERRVNLRA